MGIGGGPASGKATLAKLISSNLSSKPLVLRLNDFLKPPRKKSLIDSEQKEKEEIKIIDTHYDFD